MRPRPSILLPAGLVFLSVVALYFPTLRGGFVYDSIAQVLYSDYIHTTAHWGDVLTLRVIARDELDRNRPLHLASLMADAALWKKNPFGYRLTSVLLHALNAALVFAVAFMAIRPGGPCREGFSPGSTGVPPVRDPTLPPDARRLSRKRRQPPDTGGTPALPGKECSAPVLAAVFGALLFALHPLVVEAVAEPSNREDLLVLLATMPGLLLVVVFGRAGRGPGVAANVALGALSLLAVTAKESGAATPFAFLAAALIFARPGLRRFLPGVVGGACAVAAFLLASYVFRPLASEVFVHQPDALAPALLAQLGLQVRLWAFQLLQVMWPSNLSAHYLPQAIAGVGFLPALALLAGALLAVLWARKTGPLVALGAAVFVLCLLPASNFAAQYHPLADRYLYAPLAGVGMLGAALLGALMLRFRARPAPTAIIAAAVLLLAVEYAANLRRQTVWQSPENLWTDVARRFPEAAIAYVGLANCAYRAEDFSAAERFAAQGVALSRARWDDALALRAVCEWQTGRHEDAAATFQELLRLSPRFRDIDSVQKSLFWPPGQIAVLHQIAAARAR